MTKGGSKIAGLISDKKNPDYKIKFETSTEITHGETNLQLHLFSHIINLIIENHNRVLD